MSRRRRLLVLVAVSITLCFVMFVIVAASAGHAAAPKPTTRHLVTVGEVEAPCPSNALMLVFFGQSNGANHVTGRIGTRPEIPAYMMLNGRCYLIHDPVLGGTRDKQTAANRGSVASRVAQRLAVRLGRPVVVLMGAVGGYSSADWLSDAWGARTWLASQIAASPLSPQHWIWMQGESDAIAGTSEALYLKRIGLLFDFYSAPGSTFWLFQQSRCGNVQSVAVRRAQATLSARPNARLLGNLDALGAAYRRPDGCHLNGRGASRAAQMISDAIAAAP